MTLSPEISRNIIDITIAHFDAFHAGILTANLAWALALLAWFIWREVRAS